MSCVVLIDGKEYKKVGNRIYWHGEKVANWKGGKTVRKDGRVMLLCPEHPYPSHGKYVYRYRIVMERHIGRFLSPSEIVHHKNRIVDDDRIENLEILDYRIHNRIHANELRHLGKWAWKHDRCVRCFTTERKHKGHGLCSRCFGKKDNL